MHIRYSAAYNDDDDGLDINGGRGNDDCGTGEDNVGDGDVDNGGSNGGCGIDGNGENGIDASKDNDGRGGGNIHEYDENKNDDGVND